MSPHQPPSPLIRIRWNITLVLKLFQQEGREIPHEAGEKIAWKCHELLG